MTKISLEQVPTCAPDPRGTPKKLTLPGGFRVGIANMDSILREVAELKLTETSAIRAELLRKAALCNYIPSSAERDYSLALFEEYKRKFLECG
ncbi:hypothetical protein SAMN04489760_11481 [Syntrophus gentianae]|uniref:Uncharacterized protein n=1 Tax=Syntrophus gentianae TaxID=43775 RepID=A0A1H7Y949_9BACT|nr:hypothetical protein [Syntrophus gentianae]SEM41847.1 hypothetical protein SAMN04489760_11481 [Syntrophus gentianae]